MIYYPKLMNKHNSVKWPTKTGVHSTIVIICRHTSGIDYDYFCFVLSCPIVLPCWRVALPNALGMRKTNLTTWIIIIIVIVSFQVNVQTRR